VPRVPLPNVGMTFTGEKFNPSPARTLLPGRRSYGLIRQSHMALLSFGSRLVQEVFAGCYQPLLPSGPSRRYLCKSFPGCLIPYPGGPTKCIHLFLPPCHRPSPIRHWVGFSRGTFRGCRYSFREIELTCIRIDRSRAWNHREWLFGRLEDLLVLAGILGC
jgi:hypothetical protein